MDLKNGPLRIEQIEEVTEEQYSSNDTNSKLYNLRVSNKQFKAVSAEIKANPKQVIKLLKKEKMMEMEFLQKQELNFINFLNSLSLILSNSELELKNLENGKDYEYFTQYKVFISELLPPRCLQDIDLVLLEHHEFKNVCVRAKEIINPRIFH